MPVIDATVATEIAEEWTAAWNSHDLDKVLALYVDDFEMRSPFIVQRGLSTNGVLKGKAAVRAYWKAGIATAPAVRLELIGALGGVDQVVIYYKSVGRRFVASVLELDDQRRIVRDSACHGAPA